MGAAYAIVSHPIDHIWVDNLFYRFERDVQFSINNSTPKIIYLSINSTQYHKESICLLLLMHLSLSLFLRFSLPFLSLLFSFSSRYFSDNMPSTPMNPKPKYKRSICTNSLPTLLTSQQGICQNNKRSCWGCLRMKDIQKNASTSTSTSTSTSIVSCEQANLFSLCLISYLRSRHSLFLY